MSVKLAESGVCLSNNLWVREIPKLTERGHQTAILATDYQSGLALIGASTFARWPQENYFKYPDEARTLLGVLHKTKVDLLPDLEKQTLTICLHHLANVISDNVIITDIGGDDHRSHGTNTRYLQKPFA